MRTHLDAPLPPDPVEPQPRSRRALLTAALGGLAGAVAGALGRPAETRAAAGDNLKIGQTNYAGSSATRLNATSSGGAFWMTQYGYGSGVRGDSVNGHGGVFTTQHGGRYGLYAQQTAVDNYGGAAVYGAGGVNKGVYGASDTNFGLQGDSDTSYGVYGASNNYIGVSGISGTHVGVYGASANNFGVHGQSTSSLGVFGSSTSGDGVYGVSSSGYGVYGNSTSSYAGYFNGSLYALSAHANIKAFRIDHPLDPANKVLMHSCVESNERKLVYDGVVTTDERGEATVSLPGYFGALNRDLRYQLTPLADARAWIKSKVTGNRFVIATSKPHTEVCWQISGVRQDAYATAHPLVVESTKTGREKGRYLTPLEHGQPERLAVDYEARQTLVALPARGR